MACALVTDTSDVLYSIFLGLDSHSAKDAKTKDVFNYSLERERERGRGEKERLLLGDQ